MECTDEQGASRGGWSFRISIAESAVVAVMVANTCTSGSVWSAAADALAVPVVKDGTTMVPLKCTITGATSEPTEHDCPLSFQLRGGEIRIANLPGSTSGSEVTGTCSWVVR